MVNNNASLKVNGHKLPKKIGIIYSDVKRSYFPTKEQYVTEVEAYVNAKVFRRYLKKMGFTVTLYPGNANLAANLKRNKPQIVINLVDSVKGSEFLSSAIPGVLEILEIPYAGCGILGLSLGYNKFLVNKLFEQNGIPVPNYQLFNSSKDPLYSNLRFPLISKLNDIHGAVELDKNCISETEKHLRDRLKYLIKTYNTSVLVEEFIVGKEVTAVVLESVKKKTYIGELVFKKKVNKYAYKAYELQWLDDFPGAIEYQKYKDPVLGEYAKKAFSIMEMQDYGRFDIRVDSSGRYYFIDANCNPEIGPITFNCPLTHVLDLYGVTFQDFIKKILTNAVKEW